MALDTIVVGGGIAGLSCAWELAAVGREVLVLEAREEAGGNVRTAAADGFRFERGPHTFMASAGDVFRLAEEAGVGGAVAPADPSADRRFIVRRGVMHPVPTGPVSFLTSGLLSLRGKLNLAGEPLRTRRGSPNDTAMEFFERRFGREAARVLAGAFISGVYAGDPARLSAPAAFPLFWKFEQESGGMIRGALALRKKRRAERRARGETGKPRKGLFSFRNGLGQLTGALAGTLGDGVRVNAPARAVARNGRGWTVETDAERLSAEHLVLAVPPAAASRLLVPVDEELGTVLGRIPLAPVAVVHLGYRRRAARVPDGFGFLAPRGEGVRTLGILFPSRLFPGRAPEGGDLFTGFVGGMLDRGALELDDGELISIVRGDLARLTGFDRRPDFVRVARYPEAIPQLTLGHLDRLSRIRERLGAHPGLLLAGNYLRGIGMKDAVASGLEAAANLLAERREVMAR